MFYQLIKITARLALKIFCCRISISPRELLKSAGPLLVVANHPNSFLDAIIIGCSFNRPVHFLARGDAFNKPWHNRLLRLLNMIPVYRLSEGKENLLLNETAFSRSKEVLAQNGIVLIFIEGICKHTHELQPFKKGAARIALDSMRLENFRVMPLGIAYHSFHSFGKYVNIHIGELVGVKTFLPFEDEAKNMRYFNSSMQEEIQKRIQIPKGKKNRAISIAFFVPAIAGIVLHLPLYSFLKRTIRKKTAGTVFFDSVLYGALLLVYPIYLILAGILLYLLHIPVTLILCILVAHPVTAWFAVWWKTASRPY